MQSTSDIDVDTETTCQRRGAAQVFWMWLIVATAMSVTGNVADAVLHADSRIVALAAGAALVPLLVANDRKASNDNTNAQEANASVISSAHLYVNPPARVHTRTAMECVAANSTNRHDQSATRSSQSTCAARESVSLNVMRPRSNILRRDLTAAVPLAITANTRGRGKLIRAAAGQA
jgi:hypothetical protein